MLKTIGPAWLLVRQSLSGDRSDRRSVQDSPRIARMNADDTDHLCASAFIRVIRGGSSFLSLHRSLWCVVRRNDQFRAAIHQRENDLRIFMMTDQLPLVPLVDARQVISEDTLRGFKGVICTRSRARKEAVSGHRFLTGAALRNVSSSPGRRITVSVGFRPRLRNLTPSGLGCSKSHLV